MNARSTAPERQQLLAEAETIVVKVGSRVLSGPEGRLNVSRIENLAAQMASVAREGKQVALVSSGAVACGMGKLELESRPTDVSQLQAIASVGQAQLIHHYESFLASHEKHAAQVLLTADDFDHRLRYLNVRNTLTTLLEMGVIPIINENDSVSVDELLTTFGDNDRLAAMVAGLFPNPVLIILSDVAGLFPADVRPNEPQEVISLVDQIDSRIFEHVSDKTSSGTGLSKGGMASKLKAAQFATRGGGAVIIASGHEDNVVPRLMNGEDLGTLFTPQSRALAPKKRWLGFSAQTVGILTVDDGACRALTTKASLLAIGIRDVEGEFAKGDVVSIRDLAGQEIARGLSNYDSTELKKIKGLRSHSFQQVLGHAPYEEVVHRDNMAPV